MFAYLAGCTNLAFATSILIGPQRQTALLAKQAAELDLLCGGRFRLGLGIGWNKLEYDALGVRVRPAGGHSGGAGRRAARALDAAERHRRRPLPPHPGVRAGSAPGAATDPDLDRRPRPGRAAPGRAVSPTAGSPWSAPAAAWSRRSRPSARGRPRSAATCRRFAFEGRLEYGTPRPRQDRRARPPLEGGGGEPPVAQHDARRLARASTRTSPRWRRWRRSCCRAAAGCRRANMRHAGRDVPGRTDPGRTSRRRPRRRSPRSGAASGAPASAAHRPTSPCCAAWPSSARDGWTRPSSRTPSRRRTCSPGRRRRSWPSSARGGCAVCAARSSGRLLHLSRARGHHRSGRRVPRVEPAHLDQGRRARRRRGGGAGRRQRRPRPDPGQLAPGRSGQGPAGALGRLRAWLGGVAAAPSGPSSSSSCSGAGWSRSPSRARSRPPETPARASWRPLGVVVTGGLGALAWVALKVGALSFGGGFVIIPLMQADAVHHYHWMTNAQFLNAVALGQITPGPVVQTVAVVGYAAAGRGRRAAGGPRRVRSVVPVHCPGGPALRRAADQPGGAVLPGRCGPGGHRRDRRRLHPPRAGLRTCGRSRSSPARWP